ELVGLVGERGEVVLARQAFAEARHIERPTARLLQTTLELYPEPDLASPASPASAAGAALVPEAAHVIAARGVVSQVPEAGDVDPVGTMALVVAVEQAVDVAARPGEEMMVHQIDAQYTARVGEAGGEARRRGREEVPIGGGRRGAGDDQVGVGFAGCPSLGVQ